MRELLPNFITVARQFGYYQGHWCGNCLAPSAIMYPQKIDKQEGEERSVDSRAKPKSYFLQPWSDCNGRKRPESNQRLVG